jgi:hypothetical protein
MLVASRPPGLLDPLPVRVLAPVTLIVFHVGCSRIR